MTDIKKRLTRWAIGVAALLLIPLVLTLLGSGVDGDGWHWTFFDFVFAFVVLFGAGLTYELVARKSKSKGYKMAVGVAVVAALLLVWINAAVGIIGDGDFPNGLYFGVLAIGFVFSLIARFNPRGMSRALFVTAIAQALVPFIALFIWSPSTTSWSPGVPQVFVFNTFFVVMFLISAFLFHRAAGEYK